MNFSGISVSYIVNGKPVLGTVLDISNKTAYFAARGFRSMKSYHGLDWQHIHVGEKRHFGLDTRSAHSNSSAKGGTRKNLRRQLRLGEFWDDGLGSAVLIGAKVADGGLDLYHHNGLKPWDNPAMFLLVEMAGGIVRDLKGKITNWLTSNVLMGNREIVDQAVRRTTIAGALGNLLFRRKPVIEGYDDIAEPKLIEGVHVALT